MTTRSRALRNTVFASIGIYTEYFLGMLAAIVIARHLGPAHYGIYSLGIWFAAVGIVLTNSGVTTGIIKFIAELRGSQREDLIVPLVQYMRRVQRWHFVVVMGIAAVIFLIAGQRVAQGLNYRELALLAFAVGLRAPNMFNIAVTKGFEAFDATAKVALIAAPLNLALVVGAMLLGASLEWFLVVYAISSVVFFLASHYQARLLLADRSTGIALPDALLHRVRRHLRIVSVTVIVGFLVLSEVEVLFLNMYDHPASAGYFKAAYQLAKGVTLLLPGVFGAVLLPLMANALSQGQAVAGRRFAAATTYLALLAAPLVAFGTTFAAAVIGLLYGPAYSAAVPVFAFCLFASAYGVVAQGASSLLLSADRQHTILMLTILFGALKFILDIALISHFGLHGAIVAIVIETVASSSTYLMVAMRISGARLHWGRLLRIIVSAALAALAALPIRELAWPPLWTLFAGGSVVALVYALLTLVLKCWSRDDIAQIQDLHHRFAAGRPLLLARLLGWAGSRTERETS